MLIKFNREGGPIQCPCKDCPDREVTTDESGKTRTCHMHCREYSEYKDMVKEYNDAKRAENEKNYFSETKKKWLAKKQRNRPRKNSVEY